MPNDTKDILHKIYEMTATGGIGIFGGVAFYLYKVSQGEKFKWGMFFINALLAFWVATIVGDFLPTTIDYRDGLIGIASFSTHPILGIIEKKGGTFISNKILGTEEE